MDQTKIIARCRALMDADKAAGRLRPMASYQNLFAGYEELVESVYESLDGTPPEPAPKPEPQKDEPLSASRAATLLEHVQFYAKERYRYGGEIGEGAMGRVLEVLDQGLERSIAMKVLHEGSDGSVSAVPEPGTAIDPAVHRFIREARIMAQLDHPGIVPVYDFGLNPDKRIFFTMKRVEGDELATLFDRYKERDPKWPLQRLAQILVRAAEAIGFAHSRAIVHRDLKPANIMVGGFGEVYVMDWGLAKVLDVADDDELSDSTLNESGALDLANDDTLGTRVGSAIGSPTYMPPEQAAGELERIGPASDVYGLGACLYHLLAGAPPYVAGRERPSNALQVVLAVQKGPPEPLARVAPDAPAELVAIAEKAMARDPADRYANGSEFGADLQSYLDGRVVSAHRTGPWIAFSKWIGRNRALAGTLAAMLFVVVCGSIFVAVQQYRAKTRVETERGRALAAAEEERKARELAEQATEREATARAAAETARTEAEQAQAKEAEARGAAEKSAEAERKARREANGERLAAQAISLAKDDASLALILGLRAATWTSGALMRDALATSLDGLREVRAVVDDAEGYVLAGAFAPDGRTVISAGHDRYVSIWNPDDRADPRRVPVDTDAWIMAVAVSPDGARFATFSMESNTLRVFDLAEGKQLGRVSLGPAVGNFGGIALFRAKHAFRLRYSADGRYLLLTGTRLGWQLVDATTIHKVRGAKEQAAVADAVFSPDGSRIAILRKDGALAVEETASGQSVGRWPNPEASTVGKQGWCRFRAGGQELVVGFYEGADASAYVRRIEDGDLRHIRPNIGACAFADGGNVFVTWKRLRRRSGTVTELMAHEIASDQVRHRVEVRGSFRQVFPQADGPRIALLQQGEPPTAVVWNARTGRIDARLVGHFGPIQDVEWSPDGRRLMTGSLDFSSRVWDAFDPREVNATWPVPPPDGYRVRALSVVGDRLVLDWPEQDERPAVLVELSTGRLLARLDRDGVNPARVTFAKNGGWLAVSFPEEKRIVWKFHEAVQGALRHTIATRGENGVLSPDGCLFATWSKTTPIDTIDVAKGTPHVGVPVIGASNASFSPDGRRLASSDGTNHSDTLWDLEERRAVFHFQDRGGMPFATAWSPDGGTYISTAADRGLFFRDTQDGKKHRRIAGLPGGRLIPDWSPDGRWISVLFNAGCQIYDAQTRRLFRRIDSPQIRTRFAEFHPEKQELWMADESGRVMRYAIDVIAAARARAPRDVTLEELNRYRALEPGARWSRTPRSFYLTQRQTNGQIRRGEYEDALANLERIMPTRGYLAILHLERARALVGLERLDEAMDALRAAWERAPMDVRHSVLGGEVGANRFATDPRLKPLWEREDFLALLAEMRKEPEFFR